MNRTPTLVVYALAIGVSALLLLLGPRPTHALPDYLTAFNNFYARSYDCTVCHTSAAGGTRNVYGLSFQAIGTHATNPTGAFVTIQNFDSDNDGWSNVEEIRRRTFPGASASFPRASITTTSPSTTLAGGPAFSLQITGKNFRSSSIVRWNGSERIVTSRSISSDGSNDTLFASILAADIASGPSGTVTVVNPSPGASTASRAITVTDTLSVALGAAPSTGTAPVATTLTATVVSTASALSTINYYFWWNCSNTSTLLTTVKNSCGDPSDPSIGAVFEGTTANPRTADHTYTAGGTFTAKVLVQRSNAAPAEARTTLVIAPPTLAVTLGANPASGVTPLPVQLSATVTGSSTGPINYFFWWNCADSGTSLATVSASCGDPHNPAIGFAAEGTANNPQTTSRTYATAGSFTAKVLVQRGNAAPVEARTTITVEVPFRPDLVVTTVTAPATGAIGRSIGISVTIRNQGPARAGAFDIGFYLSTDPTPGSGIRLGVRPITELLADAAVSRAPMFTIPTTTAPGNYFISVVADINGVITELSEANNGLTAPAQISITRFRPDLVLTALTARPTGFIGRLSPIQFTVRNQGPARAGTFHIGFYLSTDPTPGTGTRLGVREVLELLPGTSVTRSPNLPIPAATAPGNYFVSAVVDIDGVITELTETNNGLTAPAQISLSPFRPDLVVATFSGPLDSVAGQSIPVQITVANQGPAAAGAFRIGFYLSQDPTPGTGTRIGVRDISQLLAGANVSRMPSLPIPATMAPGEYFLSAVADIAGVIKELDETNNSQTRPLSLGASQALAATRAEMRPIVLVPVAPSHLGIVDSRGTSLRTVALSALPIAAAIRADGARIYVTTEGGTVGAIDGHTLAVHETTIGERVGGLALSADESKLYIAAPDTGRVLVRDATTLAAVHQPIAADGVVDIRRDHAGRHVYLLGDITGGVPVLDTHADGIVTHVPASAPSNDIAFTPDGTRAIVSDGALDCETGSGGVTIIETLTNAIVRRVDVARAMGGVAVGTDGATALVSDVCGVDGGLLSVDPLAGAVRGKILAGHTLVTVRTGAEGEVAYALERTAAGLTSLLVLDVARGEIVVALPLGAIEPRPNSLATGWSPLRD